MCKKLATYCLLILLLPLTSASAEPSKNSSTTVFLLHGLARTATSMEPLQHALKIAGYQTVNIAYPSTSLTPNQLFQFIDRRVTYFSAKYTQPHTIHFVTHSMGGIIARDWVKHYLEGKSQANVELGRMVMLAPPNQGSEMIDTFSSDNFPFHRAFTQFFGPSAIQLHTGGSSWPNSLPKAQIETGVIAADFGLNPVGAVILPGKDDGAVALEKNHLKGELDFIQIATGHTRIKKSKEAAKQVICFLQRGRFCYQQ